MRGVRRRDRAYAVTHEIPQPLPPLTPDERALVLRLGERELVAIDEALLAAAGPRWRKVAMLVARAMDSPSYVRGIPDTFYGQRVCKLVQEGRLEGQGNVEYIHFSEVRLPIPEDQGAPPSA
jgi:Protein of unknown function